MSPTAEPRKTRAARRASLHDIRKKTKNHVKEPTPVTIEGNLISEEGTRRAGIIATWPPGPSNSWPSIVVPTTTERALIIGQP